MGNRDARTFKDTFWGRLRVQNGITVREIADLLGMKEGYVGMLFTGQRMPTDDTIKTLCEFFSVDILTGTQEFKNAHRAWDAEYERTGMQVLAKTPTRAPHTPEVKKPDKPDEQSDPSLPILSRLYTKVSCEDFLKIKEILDNTPDDANVFEAIYGNVPFRTFVTIYRDFVLAKEEVK